MSTFGSVLKIQKCFFQAEKIDLSLVPRLKENFNVGQNNTVMMRSKSIHISNHQQIQKSIRPLFLFQLELDENTLKCSRFSVSF